MSAPAVLALIMTLQAGQIAPGALARPAPAGPARAAAVFDPMSCAAMRNDARLADVCFVDLRHGWAVGDRGTIWHTADGGRQWQLQHSGVGCPLTSVFFLDEKTGWAAGGFSHPYTHSSSGVLLSTADGGRHWRRSPQMLLPALKRIGFFNARDGWAIGCPSAMYPTGVFVTESGGRSWRPVPAERTADYLAGDFLDGTTGALAGRKGAVAMVQRGGVRPARVGSFGLRNLRRLKLVAPVYGWLIGDGGLVMMTGDLGASWQTPPGAMPEQMPHHFDFSAMAVRGPRCWVAGSPGSRVFHSPDAGRTWQAFSTGTPLPIHALAFADDRHGWAAGALGTILATEDGGRTWATQRGGGRRAAVLGVFDQPGSVPLELFTQLSGNDGYLGVVEVLGRRDVETSPAGDAHPADRLREAAVATGASDAGTAWRFPLRQDGLALDARQIVGGWDRANDARGLDQLQRHVVRQIRTWRPDVIVTHDAGGGGDRPLGHLINQLVLQAVEQAADATSFSGQITRAGVEPWQVKKVYAMMAPPSRGPTEITSAKLATRLGRSLAEVAAGPRGLLEDRFAPGPQTLGFRLLVNHLPQDRGRRDFFSGIVLCPGGDARRQLLDPPAEGLDVLARAAARRRNVQAILEKAKSEPDAGADLLAQTGTLTRHLGHDAAARVLYQLAQQYHQSGRWPLAAETFELLAEGFGEHPLARPALTWLVRYYASGEAAWRVQGGQRYAVRQASALSIDVSRHEDRPGRAAELGKRIEQTLPDLFAEPALRFPLAVAHRRQGFPRQAERFYLHQSRTPSRNAWSACAAGERWLAEPQGLAPKAVLQCAVARSRPQLDGRLDEAVWRRAKPAKLQSARKDDAQWPAQVMLAYDDEFLYIAVDCRRAPGAEYAPGEGPRPRDADLSAHDRIEVLLDLDRDFATYYRLAIDHRGWPAEDCWGERTWNPTWFVAAATPDGRWTAEAAIPMDQLTGRYPKSRHAWAIGIQRIVPGVGFQSWTAPAAIKAMPQGFGYLIFE